MRSSLPPLDSPNVSARLEQGDQYQYQPRSLKSIIEDILERNCVDSLDIKFVNSNAINWKKFLIDAYSSRPAYILDRTSYFPKELQDELQTIIPMFQFMLFPVEQNTITPALIKQLLGKAITAYQTNHNRPFNPKYQPFINELSKFSVELGEADDLSPQQILCLRLIIKNYQKYGLLGKTQAWTDLLAEKLTASLPNDNHQKYNDFLSNHATESVSDWQAMVESLLHSAFADPGFILFCINERKNIQKNPIPDTQKLSRTLEYIDRSSYEAVDQISVDSRLNTMQIQPRQLALSYGLIFEAIVFIAICHIYEKTYLQEQESIAKKYESEPYPVKKIALKMIEWRSSIESICCIQMGKYILKTPYYTRTYIDYRRYTPKELVTMGTAQLLHYLESLSYQVQDASIEVCYQSGFKRIDCLINNRLFDPFFEAFQNLLSTSPILLKAYVQYALSAAKNTPASAGSFFQHSTSRFSNLDFVKKDIHFIIAQIAQWYSTDFDTRSLKNFIFGVCEEIEDASEQTGEFMLEQFYHLLDEKIQCPEDIRATLSSSFKLWLDNHEIQVKALNNEGQTETQQVGSSL